VESPPIERGVMRVLVIAHGFPPLAEAGAEIYAHAHATALHRHFGDEVVVFAREADPDRPEYAVRTESRDGLNVVWVNNTYRGARRFEDTYRNDAIAAAAAQVMDDFKPDVAHIHHLTNLSTTIVPALARRRIPAIVTLHDYWLLCHRGQLFDTQCRVCDGPDPARCHDCIGPSAVAAPLAVAGGRVVRAIESAAPAAFARGARGAAQAIATAIARPAAAVELAAERLTHMRNVCAQVSHFLAPSHDLRERFVKFGIPEDRITVARNGIDLEPFARTTRTSVDRLRLGFLGSLIVSKAPHILLDAAQRLPLGTVSVDLFGGHASYHGDDRYRAQLAARLPLPGVQARGAISHDRVPDALSSIDVLVVPSVWPENSPLSIQEAFLAGVPVVASRIGGIPEAVIDGVNGLLFRPGDSDDLARALERLLHEPGLLDRLRRGIPSVRSIRTDVEAAREVYRDAIARTAIPAARRAPRLAAVVLNYRTPDDTLLTVRSLLALRRPPDDIVVVNNDVRGSSDEAEAGLAPVAGLITWIETGRNLGFSGGMNVGIRRALEQGADQVVLVNSDVIVPPDCVERLQACLAGAPAAGIAGPVVLSRSEPDRIASLGMSYAPRTGRMRHTCFGTRIGDRRQLPEQQVVDGVSGCLMLVSRQVFEAVGLLDEDYFFSFEDLEFCLRARRAGFTTILAGHAVVHHEGGRSIGATSPARLYFATRNHLRLGAGAASSAGRLDHVARDASILALNVAHAVRSSGASLPVRLAAVARGARDYFAGRMGSGTFEG
jgi:GT2 family glycosyltransferase/glycosyltransferase involved in cell wall biosynthesis